MIRALGVSRVEQQTFVGPHQLDSCQNISLNKQINKVKQTSKVFGPKGMECAPGFYSTYIYRFASYLVFIWCHSWFINS